MSLTHTKAPAATRARPIAAPTPLPPPVTSARRPAHLISNPTAGLSDSHDDGGHDRPPPRALVDELAERAPRVPAQRVELERALVDRFVERHLNDLLGVFDQVLRLGGVDPASRDDLGTGHD